MPEQLDVVSAMTRIFSTAEPGLDRKIATVELDRWSQDIKQLETKLFDGVGTGKPRRQNNELVGIEPRQGMDFSCHCYKAPRYFLQDPVSGPRSKHLIDLVQPFEMDTDQ